MTFTTLLSSIVFALGQIRPFHPLDVAPPMPVLLAMGGIALLIIAIILSIIVFIALRVIRRIKQNSADNEDE